MRKSTDLSHTDDIEKLAEFFDRTDTQELEGEDTEVEFKKPELVHISVRLPNEECPSYKKSGPEKGARVHNLSSYDTAGSNSKRVKLR